jgi:hypothetical protein
MTNLVYPIVYHIHFEKSVNAEDIVELLTRIAPLPNIQIIAEDGAVTKNRATIVLRK